MNPLERIGATLAILVVALFGACTSGGFDETPVIVDDNSLTVPSPVVTDSPPATQDPNETDPDQDGFDVTEDFCPEEAGPFNGCPDSDRDGVPDVLEDPEPTPSAAPPEGDVVLRSEWFASDAQLVLPELRQLDLGVVEILVCSPLVESDQIAAIIDTADGTVLLDARGVSDPGATIEPGTVIEVRVGSQESCE